MSIPPPAQPKPASPKPGTRPAARRAAALPAKPRPDYRLPVAAGILALILGFVLGIVVMRHRRAGTEVVASVNGTVITKDDFFEKLQSVAGQAVAHKMVEEDLQLQFARTKGVVPTDAEVDAQMARDQQNPEFQKALTARGLTLAAYRDALRVRLAQSMVYSQGVTVTDAEARAWYKNASNPANPNAPYYTPESVSLSVITVPTLALAKQAMTELNSGTPFPLVATTYSVDSSRANGGAIAPLVLGRNPLSNTPALEQALFKLPVGGTSPIEDFGKLHIKGFGNQLWIFHCNSKTPAQTLPFSAVETEVRQNARAAKGMKLNGKAIAKDFAAFQKSSQLKAFWPQYEQAVTGH